MMKKTKESGFAVLPIILVVVVIASIAAVGYLVYQRRTNNSQELNTAKDISQTENELREKDETLDNNLSSETQKLDNVTKDVQ